MKHISLNVSIMFMNKRGIMEALLKFIEDMINSQGISGIWISACFGIAGLGVSIFYIIKSIMILQTQLKPSTDTATKPDLATLKATLQEDNKYILKLLEGVHDRLRREVFERLLNIENANEHLLVISRELESEIEKANTISENVKDMQDQDLKTTTAILHDVDSLVRDSKIQHQEISRQVQALQVDLASLHGTLIGLNTQRTRLK